MPKKVKTVWVFPGGGNQAAYACGACAAAKDLGIPAPEVIIASSGGAANAFYYVAGQTNRAMQIWGHEISSKKILSGARFWRMFNRDLMIDGVFMKKPGALNLAKIKRSPIDIHIGVTDSRKGTIEFVSNRDPVDLLKLLKATMTVPVFSGFGDQSIEINGTRCMDSRVSSRYELLLKKALSYNPHRIIIFGSMQSKKYRFGGGYLFYGLWLVGRSLRNLNFEFMKNQLLLLREVGKISVPASRNIIFLCPHRKIDLLPWVNTEESLQRLLKQGYDDTMKRKDLRRAYT